MSSSHDVSKPFSCMLKIQFPSARLAKIAFNSLDVDKELRPQLIKRTLLTENEFLLVQFSSENVKLLRTAVSGFQDYLMLVYQTISEFSVPSACD